MWAPFDTRAVCECTGHTPKNPADEKLVTGLAEEMSLAFFRMRKKAIEAWWVGRRMKKMRSVRREGADDIGLYRPV